MSLSPQQTHLLDLIEQPADLRALSRGSLPALVEEMRHALLAQVEETGGHLSANLGVVELTLALHRVFDTPYDRLVWDVGHQAYLHKMLTGRRSWMAKLRQRGGPAGFTRREESEHDPFGAGHSSTSVSAALGMALAAEQRGEDRQAVAIIGDGAMTAGQAFEALNHAGDRQANLLVILNDNEMSISPNVGALNQHFTRLRSNPLVERFRHSGEELLAQAGPLGELLESTRAGLRDGVRHLLGTSSLFEELGFRYYGPIDGHDLDTLLDTLTNLREQSGPRLLHVVTQKGRGLAPAERDPVGFHGVARNGVSQAVDTARPPAKAPKPPSWTEAAADYLCKKAAADDRVVAITPAMVEGSGLKGFQSRFPKRLFDVGIAEQHAVTLAGGLAAEGLRPVVAIYSTFLQRAWDQVIHDIALQHLPVTFLVDRAGLVGPDGPTHAGSFDLALGMSVPNLAVAVPADRRDLETAMDWALAHDGPVLIRYPRDRCPQDLGGETLGDEPTSPRLLRRGRTVLVVGIGAMVERLVAVCEELDATLLDLRWAKPSSIDSLAELAREHDAVVTVEEGSRIGGVGSELLHALSEQGLGRPGLRLGLDDRFIEHGTREECLADSGLDSRSIRDNIAAFLDKVSAT
ncbi:MULTISPECIES: 1-deoxy-D-xylulose-5-phosphate synthase [unclassified Guyparkeria]|uniref:1-deoxy-D-xylulose-5-phosphate synthase n=1 Tax=unclassified Guyparkeria TaxID=2626246 RepID=UPI0007333A52|nr:MULTISPECIES: 1-deoxy-D-xylulose-5-phosphate synthase [unclassified Guyparkeria]KTG16426.1 1-deoxy-D-xylulose-5-phosphate synthase [Guyparkeria sp. XI15]OAE85366.1 1-deoxy-D-xylulose-5-phosphate synthase [Guyparkeria sp. WRN-7]